MLDIKVSLKGCEVIGGGSPEQVVHEATMIIHAAITLVSNAKNIDYDAAKIIVMTKLLNIEKSETEVIDKSEETRKKFESFLKDIIGGL